jgi:hypothetical protein
MQRLGREFVRHISVGRRGAEGLALFAIILASIAVTALVIRPAQAITPHATQVAREHDDPRDAHAYFMQRHYGSKSVAPDATTKAFAQVAKMPRLNLRRASAGKQVSGPGLPPSLSGNPTYTGTWVPLGPAPLVDQYGHAGERDTGRVTALAVDPTNANILWVGAADGGLWRSTDGGSTYQVTSDSWDTTAIGSIAIDPNNHNTVYVGTGEGNFSGDNYWGTGIYKTITGGDATPTWTQLGNDLFAGLSVPKIAIDPQ